LPFNYQNPRESDALSRVQAEVDETKVILVGKFSCVIVRLMLVGHTIYCVSIP